VSEWDLTKHYGKKNSMLQNITHSSKLEGFLLETPKQRNVVANSDVASEGMKL
jgi:hypothetical protein